MNPFPTPRERLIPRLLWISLAMSLIIFGLSMAWIGYMSYFLSPSGAGASLIFAITMLTLRAKQLKLLAKQQIDKPLNKLPPSQDGHSSPPATFPPKPNPSGAPPSHNALPCYCRLPSMFVALLITLHWMADFPLLLHNTILFNSWTEDWGEITPQRILPATILEIILVALHIGVWVAICELCRRERRRLLNLEGKVKWYQLGRYDQA